MQIDPAQIWSDYGEVLIASAFNVISAAAILVIGLAVANWAGSTMRHMASKHPRVDDTLAAFFSWMVRYGLTAFVIIAVLNRFGVATTSIVAVVGAGALAIGLALQGTLSNLAAGVMLMLFRPYRLGDFVELSGRTGTVHDVNLFATELVTPENVKIVLPNGLCWGGPMLNYTAFPKRRIDLEFGVSYDTDLDHAIAVLENMVHDHPRVLAEPPPRVQVKALGDFAVTILVRAWGPAREYLDVRSALAKAGKEALDAHGVTIPFPTTTNYEVRLNVPSVSDRPKLKPRAAPEGDRGAFESGDG